nr:hypothetical protein CFP56_13042 [Quercus suber]
MHVGENMHQSAQAQCDLSPGICAVIDMKLGIRVSLTGASRLRPSTYDRIARSKIFTSSPVKRSAFLLEQATGKAACASDPCSSRAMLVGCLLR